jgi:hypothetical protein
MKNIKTLLLLTFFFTATNLAAQSTFEKWDAIKTFHEAIATTYHACENGNFEPIKTRSEEMMQKAQALSTQEIPEEFKTLSVLAAIERLQSKTKEMHQIMLAKTSDKDDITQNLKEVHDAFHDIVGLCHKD